MNLILHTANQKPATYKEKKHSHFTHVMSFNPSISSSSLHTWTTKARVAAGNWRQKMLSGGTVLVEYKYTIKINKKARVHFAFCKNRRTLRRCHDPTIWTHSCRSLVPFIDYLNLLISHCNLIINDLLAFSKHGPENLWNLFHFCLKL